MSARKNYENWVRLYDVAVTRLDEVMRDNPGDLSSAPGFQHAYDEVQRAQRRMSEAHAAWMQEVEAAK